MPAITSILSTAAAFVGLGLAVPHSSIAARQLATRSNASPSVTIKNGTIAGIHQPDYNQDFFLGKSSSSSRATTIRYAVTKCPLCATGIPFAQPPLEQLRFRNPQSINASYDGVFQATEYAPMCYGYGVRFIFLFFLFLFLFIFLSIFCFILLIIHRWRLT